MADKLKDVCQLGRGLGQGQYADLVYAWDFGMTEQDVCVTRTTVPGG